jgi:hypothetical protein
MKRISILLRIIFPFLITQYCLADDIGWEGFYEKSVLKQRERTSIPDIRAIFEQDLPRYLTPEQRKKLAHISIKFPLTEPTLPLNFYSDVKTGEVIFPVSSIQFLRDLTLAYSWLSVNGYDLQPITDYLVMIHYQWANGKLLGKKHTPLDALGIPTNAIDDAKVADRFQKLFGSMVVFTLGHELGHIYHDHQGNAPQYEQEADQFGLGLLKNYGALPTGVGLFFHIYSHLDPFPGDASYANNIANRTHPLGPSRLQAVIDDIKQNGTSYSVGQNVLVASEKLNQLVKDLSTVKNVLADENVQSGLRSAGLAATPEMLSPRRPGETPILQGENSGVTSEYSGTYIGKWLDSKGSDMDVKMVLNRSDEAINGSYTLYTSDPKTGKLITGGAGYVITLNGALRSGKLEYSWQWGSDRFGRGRLLSKDGGKNITGTWGYNKSPDDAGTWQLQRFSQ